MFTKENVSFISNDIKKVLEGIERKYNIKISQSGSYSEGEFNLKLRIIPESLNMRSKSMEKECLILGLPKDLIGKTFDNGQSVIIDIKLRNRKYPIIFEKNGKSYKITTETIKRYIKEGILK